VAYLESETKNGNVTYYDGGMIGICKGDKCIPLDWSRLRSENSLLFERMEEDSLPGPYIDTRDRIGDR
jgi:hypothetical protein